MWEGPEEVLQQTDVTQPAILAHSAAVLAVVRDWLGAGAGAAGARLGGGRAYVSAGALPAVHAARLVRKRGELMHRAGTQRPGAMAAVMGLATAEVERACREAREEEGGEDGS